MIQYSKKGFTLIELTLALAFVSVLLISIATTTIQLGQTYNRGLTIKSLNQAGRNIISELQRTINSGITFNITDGYIHDNIGGRLCTGTYSYVWNYGKSLNNSSVTNNKYVNSKSPIRFAKVIDSGGTYCSYTDTPPNIIDDNATEMLTVGDRELAIQSFTVSSKDSSYDAVTNSRAYYFSFTIGTNKASELSSDYLSCLAPGVKGSNLTYCTVQTYTINLITGSSTN
jgi:prepilin-type N-terminal cleavage/methylation domain-containing protein